MLAPRPAPHAATAPAFLWGRFVVAVGVAGLLVAGFVLGCQPSPAPVQTALFSGLIVWGLWESARAGLYRGVAADDEPEERPWDLAAMLKSLGTVAGVAGVVVLAAGFVLQDPSTASRLQLSAVSAATVRYLFAGGVLAVALGAGAWAAVLLGRGGERS
jgi:hypothetical protein